MPLSKAKQFRAARQRRLAILMLVGVCIAVGGLFVVRGIVQRNTVTLDELLCPEESGPVAYTAILIDGTDAFNAVQRADVERRLTAVLDSSSPEAVARGEQVTIFAPRELSPEDLLAPYLRVCNPGDASGVSGTTQNPRQIQQRYEDGFASQLDAALAVGLEGSVAEQSPIMAMIQAVAISAFPPDRPDLPKRLFIVSDMLENTGEYSHYRDSLDFTSIQGQAFFAHLLADLQGAEVSILYVTRPGTERLQTRRHVQFWEEYFDFVNARLVGVSRIGG